MMFRRLPNPVAKTAPAPGPFISSLYWAKGMAAAAVIRATTPKTISVNMDRGETHQDAHDASQQAKHDDVKGHVIEGQGETPNGQHRADKAEDDGEQAPGEFTLGQGAQDLIRGKNLSQVDAHQGNEHADHGDHQDVDPPAVDHLARPGRGRRSAWTPCPRHNRGPNR